MVAAGHRAESPAKKADWRRSVVIVCSAFASLMLGVTFKLAKTAPLYGVSPLLACGIGYCAAIVAADTSTEAVQCFLNCNERSKGLAVVTYICGGLVILGGGWCIYAAG